MAVKVRPKPLFIVIVVAVLLIILGLTITVLTSPVDARDNNEVEVSISSGTGIVTISNILKEKDLIRSKTLFRIYAKFYRNKTLKAGTYKLKRSMNLNEIVDSLESGGYSGDNLRLTFKEGERITDYAKTISNNTNNSYNEVLGVFRDNMYMQELIGKYWFLTDDIMNKDIYYSLEGYLIPDTYYFKDSNVTTKEIIERMLNETDKKLSMYREVLGNNIHYYLTMASIIELEGKTYEDRQNIMGVFNNRLRIGMHLGSDVTTYYAFQVPLSGKLTQDQYNTPNPYNTRPTNKEGPPVGPICNPSIESIKAAIYPINNNYLYFVADSDGKVYYSRTSDEQNRVIKELISRGKWNG